MTTRSTFVFIFLFLSVIHCIHAQDVLQALEDASVEDSSPTIATFKGTRISIGQSVETRKKGSLEISWMNRFWNRPLPEGQVTTQSFAADRWNTRIGVDYSISDRLTVGAGYVSEYESVDLYGKYRLFYQRDTGRKFPVSISLFQGGVFRDNTLNGASFEVPDSNKFASTTQLLIARKVDKNFSVQLAPSFIYRAEDELIENESTTYFALGFGARYKVGNHVSLVSEYYYVPSPFVSIDTYGPFSIGANWEVSDLLLQFKLTNARDFVEDNVIVKTLNNFNFRDGNLHFGFQATYFLQL